MLIQNDVRHDEEETITTVIKERGQYIIEEEENEDEEDDTIQKEKYYSEVEEKSVNTARNRIVNTCLSAKTAQTGYTSSEPIYPYTKYAC